MYLLRDRAERWFSDKLAASGSPMLFVSVFSYCIRENIFFSISGSSLRLSFLDFFSFLCLP